MNLLIPSSKISHQFHPCPNCHAPTPVNIITEIESEEDLTHFISHGLNRARCSSCGARVEAPVRVTVWFPDYPMMNHDCVPIALLQDPEVLDDLLDNSPAGSHRVYSHDELERAVVAWLQLEMRRDTRLPKDAGPIESR